MSKLSAGIREAYYSIREWRGVNENPDGDTNLRDGEAAVMRNFRITDGGALRKRPGSAVVAGLLNGYTLALGEEQAVRVETGASQWSAEAHFSANADSVGMVVLTGEGTELNADSAPELAGYYYGENGQIWQHSRVELSADGNTEGAARAIGGYVKVAAEQITFLPGFEALCFYELPTVRQSAVTLEGDCTALTVGSVVTEELKSMYGKYLYAKAALVPAGVYRLSGAERVYDDYGDGTGMVYVKLYLQAVSFAANDLYTWYARPVTAVSNSADTAVRGLWSGYVGGEEVIVAACSGHLWSLLETEGQWSKTDIGVIDSSGPVCLFGFGGKLYCLDGTDYWSWDGTTFVRVSGYVPCLAVASAPGGGGTTLERVNTLTARRRQRFSADGESTVYRLLEQNIVSIDRVTVDGAETDAWTANLSEGTVTFSTAPQSGTDNVEIWWTAPEDYRGKVVSMRCAEFYNGVTDSRVFLYGDGSNVAVYSDLTEDGTPTAEYFPDLNEIAVGDENTPLTALIRQYSRLMAFKAGSAWSIFYDAITLADGTVTAGFYCSPVNRSIGNDAPGQVCLVENRPRTLDGRSIYEWRATSTSGNITNDQRNAQRISQKVENTLLGFDLSQSLLFFDKINHEFYCVYDGAAVVQNTENEAWYVYTDFPALCLIVYKDELYYGTAAGELRRVSDDYTSDAGEAIDAYWESGSLSFGKDYVLKYSPTVWVGLKQEAGAAVTVGVETDGAETVTALVRPAGGDAMAGMNRARLKAKGFTYYKLSFRSHSALERATVTAADVRVKFGVRVR